MLGAKDTKTGAGQPPVCEITLRADELLRALLSLPSHQRVSILDSCNAREVAARFLIAGFDPFEIIEARGPELRIKRRGENIEQVIVGDVLKILDERLAKYHVPYSMPDDLPAAGAC